MKKARQYSLAFKQSLVKKMLLPGGPSAMALSKEIGISQPSLSRWVRELGQRVRPEKMGERTPEQWTSEEKVKTVLETGRLGEDELGRYLREKGIPSTWSNGKLR